jgi:CheY-like chemotaxis protein
MNETPERPVILLVDDSTDDILLMSRKLNPHATILVAHTEDQALELVKRHAGRISAIVLDGFLEGNGNKPTIPLLKEIRTRYEGLIIASSDLDKMRDHMLAHGCDAGARKEYVPGVLLGLLNERLGSG